MRRNAVVDPYSKYWGVCRHQFQPICKPLGKLSRLRCTIPAKEKIVWFCPLYVGPFLVLNPRCLTPDCAHDGDDISEGTANIVVLGKLFYHALPRVALSQDHDAQALRLRRTLIHVVS